MNHPKFPVHTTYNFILADDTFIDPYVFDGWRRDNNYYGLPIYGISPQTTKNCVEKLIHPGVLNKINVKRIIQTI